MKTFLMLDRQNGARTVPIEYRPLKVTIGDQTHELALHRSGSYWLISDPISGGGIAKVGATYKGMPWWAEKMGVREATVEARSTLAQLIHRHGGPDVFNTRLAAARAMYAG